MTRRTDAIAASFFLAALATAFAPSAANAQARDCCNTRTGEFFAADRATCEADPDNVSLQNNADPQAILRAQICIRNAQGQALGAAPAAPTLPDLPGVSTLPQEVQDILADYQGAAGPAQTYPCCDTGAGAFVDDLTPDVCRARGAGFVPDTPENLSATQICRAPNAAGGAWALEDFEPNIANGDFEEWRDENRPEGFTQAGTPLGAALAAGVDEVNTVFRSSNALTGQYSVRIKNADMLDTVPDAQEAMVRAALGGLAAPVGGMLITCDEPCPTDGQSAPGNSMAAAAQVFGSLAASDVKSHVCAAYRGYIHHADEMQLNAIVFEGGQAAAGTSSGSQARAVFTESSDDWVRFALPIFSTGGAVPETASVGVQVTIAPRNLLQQTQAGGIPSGVSNATDIEFDSLHFCSPIEFTAYEPEVLAGDTTTAIPESEEEALGVQTFVNLDNDDRDGAFDFDDVDGVYGDDELVRLRIELPQNSFGTVELTAPDIGTLYRLWDDPARTRPFDLANSELPVEEILRTSADGSVWEREVWLEAIAPSTGVAPSYLSFTFNNRLDPDSFITDRIAFTALGVESIRFNGQGNSVNDDDTLDPDPNWPSGLAGVAYRVFPGKRWSEPDGEARDEVEVEVTLTGAPVRPVTMYFRAFDVDDPSAFDDEVDDESLAEDNRGANPNRWGGFPDTDDVILELRMEGRTATFPFQVTMQPGDNFRIVGSPDRNFLAQLDNDDVEMTEHTQRPAVDIIDNRVFRETEDVVAARLPEHDRYVSDVLTVWRKLYIEQDVMDNVAGNTFTGTVAAAEDTTVDVGGGQTLNARRLTLSNNLFDQLPVKPLEVTYFTDDEAPGLQVDGGDIVGWYRAFENGIVDVGGRQYVVVSSTGRPSGQPDMLTVIGGPDSLADQASADVGQPYQLSDDDRYRNGSAVPPVDLSRMAPVFAPAYVLPTEDGVSNPNPIAPFLLNYENDEPDDLRNSYAFDNFDRHEDPDLWVVYLLAGFQGILTEDRDGIARGGGIAGHADLDAPGGSGGQGAVIYQESGRELENDYAAPPAGAPPGAVAQPTPGWRLADAPPHEIGHLFGGVHGEDGLMSDTVAGKAPDFAPSTLDKIRSRPNP